MSADLLAAANAVREWAYARRATWTDRPLPVSPLPPARHVAHAQPPPPAAIAAPPEPAAIAPPQRIAIAPRPDRSAVAPPPARTAVTPPPQRAFESPTSTAPNALKRWSRRVVLAWALIALVAAGWTMRAQWLSWFTAAKNATASLKSALPDAKIPPQSRPVAPTPATTATTLGRLQIRSVPDGARVLVDGKERGVAPLTIGDLPAGPHTLMLESSAGSVQRNVQVTAGSTTEIEEAIYPGWLTVLSTIELEISEDTRGLRLNDENAVMLPPGPHNLRFENQRLGYAVTRRVSIKPGETTAISIVPGKSSLTVSATMPAEVFIDGERAGETPLSDHAVDLGTREITIRSLTGIERHVTMTIGAQPAFLDVDFTKSP